MVRLEALAAFTLATPAMAETLLRIGAALAPNGERLGINSRYQSCNCKPWLPVIPPPPDFVENNAMLVTTSFRTPP